MITKRFAGFFCVGAVVTCLPLLCQAAITKFEAESGVLGADYSITNNGGVTWIKILSNGTNESPGNDARVATFTVNFPAAGTYDLFARVRVGSGGANDDSFFCANGFGSKSSVNAADWIRYNNLNVGGFTNSDDQVSGTGSVGIGVWKWINLSEFVNGSSEPGLTYTVTNGGLTQTFQIGAREDGFEVDALAFGTYDYVFTVANLDAGADGTPPAPPNSASCTVNWSDVRQRIDGFGASSAWRSTWNSTVADRYFSTNTGIGLSLLRTRIAPGGTSVETSIMQLARDRGARVWSAPWSPAPVAQFKSNTNLNGGNFIGNTTNYQAYANQMAGYVVSMKNTYGVNLYALSIQNEPDANVTGYESCKWTAQQIHDFIPYLYNALAASNVAATKIMLPESQNWTDPGNLRITTMNDATTAAMVGIIANHNYVPDNNNGDQTTPAAINAFGKALWETEVSTFNAFDPSMTNAMYWAGRVHKFLTSAQVNGWHYWWLSGANNEGLADSSDNLAKRGYVLGQYSRFVRPDFYRVNVQSIVGNVMVSAYKDLTNGKFAVVAINSNAVNPLTVTVSLANLSTNVVASVTPWITSSTLSLASQSAITVSNSVFTYTLPALSVVTFVGRAVSNSPPTLAPVGNLTTDAGNTVSITNVASDPNVPAQTLVFSSINAPGNAALNVNSGIVSWRPAVYQAGTTNLFTIRVTDSGSPGLSATNNFTVTVNPLTPPSFNAMTTASGQLTLTAVGPAGPDYLLLTSTNLTDWQLLTTSNSPAIPISFVISNLVESQRFYRLQLGP
jgi:glucuronoarabinoxylan endo-1,4-beta-xylanase